MEEVFDNRIIYYGTWTACPLDIIPFDLLIGQFEGQDLKNKFTQTRNVQCRDNKLNYRSFILRTNLRR